MTHAERPLAVLEIKRDAVDLTDDDKAQALSYARLLDPWAPLVIVSNGRDTRLYETFSGAPWAPSARTETAFQDLIKNAGRIAADDLRIAVKGLMGTDERVWTAAIRNKTDLEIKALTGSWEDLKRPFVRDFLIPRRATSEIVEALKGGRRAVAVSGPPLSGKSSVLRELATHLAADPDFAVMFVDADTTGDLMQCLADWLDDAVSWALNKDDARHWLRNLSKTEKPALAPVVDNLRHEKQQVVDDLTALASHTFGQGVQVVFAASDTAMGALGLSSNHRTPSRLADAALRVDLRPLDDSEYQSALGVLKSGLFGIMRGGRYCRDYWRPWVLRAICGEGSRRSARRQEVFISFMPVVDPLLLDLVRGHFDFSGPPFSLLKEVGEAFVEDTLNRAGSPELALERQESFAILRDSLRRRLPDIDMREVRLGDDENAYVARYPEIVGSEIAKILPRWLRHLQKDSPDDLANILVHLSESMPFGDVVVAGALVDLASGPRGINSKVFASLSRLAGGGRFCL